MTRRERLQELVPDLATRRARLAAHGGPATPVPTKKVATRAPKKRVRHKAANE